MNETLSKLSNKELATMKVFWQVEQPMVASEIPKQDSKLNINTVNVVIRNLLKKKYIQVNSIVYSGTVLTRSYEPTISAEQYARSQIMELLPKNKSTSTTNVVAAMLKNENPNMEVIEKLESMLLEYKENLPGKKEV